MGQQIVLFDIANRRQCSGTEYGVLLVGVVTECSVRSHIEFLACDHSGQWQDAAAQALAQHEDIRLQIVVLAGEHTPGASQRVGNLVENQECAIAVTSLANPRPVIHGREIGRAAHRLGHHCGHVAFLLQHILNVVGTAQITAAATGTVPETAVLLGRRHVLCAAQQRAGLVTKVDGPADGDGVQRRAVKGLPHGDGLVASGGQPRQLERHAHGQRSTRRKERAAETARRQLGQLLCQFHRSPVGVASRREG